MNHQDSIAPQPEETGRRTFLKLLTHGLGAAFAATLGVPAVLYFLDPRNRAAPPGAFKPVGKLSELVREGVPYVFTIREIRRDAWTLHTDDVVGRVWLIRNGDKVKAWNTTCPHLGCSVNLEGEKFVCPCHNGTFNLDGVRISAGESRTNPAPRDMDSLEVRVEADPNDPKDKLVLVKFEAFQQNVAEKVLRS